MARDGKMGEEEVWVTVNASGGIVGWVISTWDEMSNDAEDGRGFICQEGVNALEHIVDCIVLVASNSPALNDAGVVAVDEQVRFSASDESKG